MKYTLVILILFVSSARAEWDHSKMVTTERGLTRYNARSVPARLVNTWPAALEAEFQKRAHAIITNQRKTTKAGVNTYFENEKRSYGYLMAHILGGNLEKPLEYLQARDHQHDVWHRETDGIDYYACFTIKHQMRKYFYFGDLLEPDYRKLMFSGAKKWTAKDPMRRPHYAFAKKQGWGPDARNSWVDIRGTENLYLMRVTSVYLMAEETGNKETTATYRKHVLDYTKTLYRIGIGEWDSENYLGHSMAPLLNLYDFAKDPDVRAAAKACLDFYCAAGAVKYWRGGFNGPSKRDYNHAQPFGGSAASGLWVWFGEHPTGKDDHWESDEVHQITSAYRPPLAVVNLARKKFERPVEIFASKPSYTATTEFQFGSKPEYLETQFIANSFQMGSLSGGTTPGVSDVSGFKILVADEKRGAVALQAVPGPDPDFPGSPLYQEGKVSGENRVAQFANLAIWLVKDGASPWLWVVPESVKLSEEGGVTFLECDRTWVAIRSLGAGALMRDGAMSDKVSKGEKPHFPDHQVLAAKGDGKQKFCGLAVEVGEKESHGSFAEFKKAVLAAEVDVTKLDEGIIQYKSTDGKALGFHWNDNPQDLGVWRNGKRHDWMEHAKYLYWVNSADGVETTAPVFSRWGEGKLYVEAGGKAFLSTVDDGGKASFQNGTPEALRKLVAKVEDGREEIKVAGLPAQIKVYRSARPGGTNDIYTVDSDYQRGPVNVEVLTPDGYDPKGIYPVLYCLPVNTGRDGNWGHSLDEIARHDLHNRHQIICVAPEYDIDPWLRSRARHVP